MTPAEWLALPTAVRLDVLYEALRDRLAPMPAPGVNASSTSVSASAPATQWEPARPPRYDAKLGRKGGYVFMSEMLLHDLEWWLAKKREGAESGGQYAENDRKTAAELERWVAWRTQCPGEAWTGVRGEARVTAAVPARDPELHAWGDRAPAVLAPPPPAGGYSDTDYGGIDDEEIPF